MVELTSLAPDDVQRIVGSSNTVGDLWRKTMSWRERLRQRMSWLMAQRTQPPVVVYQMGKVASVSVYYSLINLPRANVWHSHRMELGYTKQVLAESPNPVKQLISSARQCFVADHWSRATRPWKFITLVREPIGRNISAFFQTHPAFDARRDTAQPDPTIDELIAEFLDRYEHDTPLRWFDREIRPVLGIDVYSEPFDATLGHHTYKGDNCELLLMRCELDDTEKAACIRSFLNLSTFQLERFNEGHDKAYDKAYSEFKSRCRLPGDYVDMLLDSKYAKHFYTAEECAELRSKWLRSKVNQA